MFKEKLTDLRNHNRLTQEDVAEKMNVSRQTVQKWESGLSFPTLDKLIRLSKLFDVTLDYLCKDLKYEADFSGRISEELLPNYKKIHEWELWSKALPIEYRQCVDEGKDIERYKGLIDEISRLPATDEKEKICDALFSLIQKLPTVDGYPYFEPNEYELIEAEQKPFEISLNKGDVDDKILGGWYGRICGCLLGKPVESIAVSELRTLCRETDNFPLHRYFDSEDLPEDIQSKITFPIVSRSFSGKLGYMPTDDDTNYMITAMEVLKRNGRDFTSDNVAEVWLSTQPKTAYCTAERIAYKNLVSGFVPPDSAEYKNAYREWIGAQIRGDVYGYINPCDPKAAAEMAWRDARISHIKNGIYGEMWVAAMIATAYGTEDRLSVIRGGLSQIPRRSRLYEAVEKICSNYENGIDGQTCFDTISKRWNERSGHDWCHTISNAQIVTAAILYGDGDYGKSICLAVEQGFDTDCNGATVGSVMGVMLGYGRLPCQWTERLNDTLQTSLCDYSKVSIKEMAEKSKSYIVED